MRAWCAPRTRDCYATLPYTVTADNRKNRPYLIILEILAETRKEELGLDRRFIQIVPVGTETFEFQRSTRVLQRFDMRMSATKHTQERRWGGRREHAHVFHSPHFW
jgi:hypothetical protein